MAAAAPVRPRFLDDVPPAQLARVAVMRFGFGPKRDQDATLWTTPYAGYDQCIRELDAPAAATINDIDMDPSGVNFRRLLEAEEVGPLASGQRAVGYNYSQEARARYAKHLIYRVGFVERLVMFWLNHFSMCFTNPTVMAFAGLVERHVIRASTLSRFETMLLGVSQSVSMLNYLNGRQSTAANTNQNFAREILELHTLGSSCDFSADRNVEMARNYEQADVEALAKILTGWGSAHGPADYQFFVRPPQLACPKAGAFTFMHRYHAEGTHSVLGKAYAAPGVAKGIAVLKDLAAHPATATHIAHEMLCHFVSDTPSEAAVQALASKFTETRGNLKEVARAMLNLEEAWTTPLQRIRQPYPWFISMMRALGVPHLALTNVAAGDAITFQDCIDGNNGYLQTLGQLPWSWRTPDGFPNRDSYWMNGDAMRMRVNVAYSFMMRMKSFPAGNAGKTLVTTCPGVPDGAKIRDGTLLKALPQTTKFNWAMPSATNLMRNALGNTLSRETADTVTRLAQTDNPSALALLFSSPEYLLA